MSEPSNNPSHEFDDLLAGLIDDELTPGQGQRLAEIVQSDSAARAVFLDHCQLHAALAWEHGVLSGMDFCEEVTVPARSKWTRPLALAAGLVLMAVLLWQGFAPTVRRNEWNSREVVGTLSRNAGGHLRVPAVEIELAQGDALRVGEYELTEGLAQIVLKNNVIVLVEAPARFSVKSSKLLALSEGRLSAKVPPEGIGFTVVTPNAEVTDHGTEFGVEVAAGTGSEIHCFQGDVEVNPRKTSMGSFHLLTDQATRVDSVSGTPSGIALAPERFLRQLDEPQRRYSRQIRDLKPALYFRMGVSDDGVTLEDKSGGSNHGRIEVGSMRRPPFSPGRHGAALRLRGPASGAYAVVPDYPKATNNQLSVVAWVLAESRSRWASIAKNWAPGEVGQFHFGLLHDQGGLEVQVIGRDNEPVQVMESEPFPINEWQHVAFVADGESLRLYRNGVEVAKASSSGLASPTIKAMGIGAKLAGSDGQNERAVSGFWHGRIDEFALFNHALDQETIRALYETEAIVDSNARSNP
jgi:hypothetical protein